MQLRAPGGTVMPASCLFGPWGLDRDATAGGAAWAVRQASTMSLDASLADCLEIVAAVWETQVRCGDLAEASAERYLALDEDFVEFASSRGCGDLRAAADLVDEWSGLWIAGLVGDARRPSPSTVHLRRCAVAAMFATLRSLGLTTIVIPSVKRVAARSVGRGRPLNEVEAHAVRNVATMMQQSRHAAAVALALCGAGTADIGGSVVACVDLAAGTVSLPGGGRIRPRTVAIAGQWEREVLANRIEDILRFGGGEQTGLVVSRAGGSTSRQAGAAIALTEVLRKALGSVSGEVRPASISRWAALVAFEASSDLGQAARLLGHASLDTAASAIGWDWSAQPAARRAIHPDFQPRVV